MRAMHGFSEEIYEINGPQQWPPRVGFRRQQMLTYEPSGGGPQNRMSRPNTPPPAPPPPPPRLLNHGSTASLNHGKVCGMMMCDKKSENFPAETNDRDLYLYSLTRVRLSIRGQEKVTLIDTNSNVSLMSESTANLFDLDPASHGGGILTVNQQWMEVCGLVETPVRIGDAEKTLLFHVIPDNQMLVKDQVILGSNSLKEFGNLELNTRMGTVRVGHRSLELVPDEHSDEKSQLS